MKREAIFGIYMIQSKIKPERTYIGSTKNIFKRFNDHRSLLRLNKHHTSKLQKHYNKYGIDDLIFVILEVIDNENKGRILDIEQDYLDKNKPWFNGAKYSFCPIRSSDDFTALHKKRISDSKKKSNFKHSDESKQKMREGHLGKCHLSDDQKETLRKRMIGNKYGEKGKGKKRKSLSKEHIENLRKSHKGIRMSEEAKLKIGAALKGRKRSKETCDKMSKRQLGEKNHMFGRKLSEDHKRKLMEGRWKRKDKVA